MISRLAPPVRLPWLLLPLLFVAGCGYSQKETFPQGVRTIAVPTLGNKSFYQGVEFDLTEALIKEIELRTPYKVVSDGADTELKGEITSIDQTRLSRRGEGGVPQEMEVRIVATFTWKDARTGRILKDRKGFVAVGRYVPSNAIREPLQTGQHLAVQRMAQDIVSEMRAEW